MNNEIDMTPICWCCGERMEYDDEVEFEMDGIVGYEPNWYCVNPMCECGEGDE